MRNYWDYRGGFSLISTIILFTMLGMAALYIAQLFSSHAKTTGRLSGKVKGDQVLVGTTTEFMQQSYTALLTLCEAKSAFAAELQGNCVRNGEFNRTIDNSTIPNITASTLEVLRDTNGEPSATGTVCVELKRCQKRAGDRLLEVSLKAYWPDPNQNIKVGEKLITFRKTRW